MRILQYTLAAIVALSVSNAGMGGDRGELRVLFVGPNPDDVRASVSDILFMYDKAESSYRGHTPAFEALLEAHFDDVGIVYGEDYTADMSDAYDVTIFDAMPPAVDGRYLPDDFDSPALLVGYVAPRVTGSFGIKLDWL
ncbi:MAG: hypothetical protein ACYTF9_08725 [Planctomycetota bacterium]